MNTSPAAVANVNVGYSIALETKLEPAAAPWPVPPFPLHDDPLHVPMPVAPPPPPK